MKKVLYATLVVVLAASFSMAQTGQGPTMLNGQITENWANINAGGLPGGANAAGLGRHSLTGQTGNSLGCETCHLPHTAPKFGSSFLWAWSAAPTSVATYLSDTNTGGPLVTPSARTANTRSILCLSCHDSASANSNGITPSIATPGMPYALINSAAGGTLGGQHPVDALIPPNSDYATVVPATTSLSATGDSVSAFIGTDNLPLWGGGTGTAKVECASCHDQHSDFQSDNGVAGGAPFLRVANTNGTALCRECHNK
jgi:hypothetical protein